MRIEIKVGDLNLRQWGYITENVPVDGRDFLPGLPRVCVVFELNADISKLHIEMDVIELASLLVVLEGITNEPSVEEVATTSRSTYPVNTTPNAAAAYEGMA